MDALDQYHLAQVLPEGAHRTLREGTLVQCSSGEVLTSEPVVRFIVSGAIGVFTAPGSSCVALVGPGSLHGLDRCFSPLTRERLVVLLDAEIVEAPADVFRAATGQAWTERMFGHQATGRLRAMAAEAACGTRHSVARRTARWLAKLSHASQRCARIAITQSLLAEMIGVQRTTVNAELRALQAQGIISTLRGSVTILSDKGLREAACSCDMTPASPLQTPLQKDASPSEPARQMVDVMSLGAC